MSDAAHAVLERELLHVFQLSMREGRPDVAEHVLKALEMLCADGDNPRLLEAYSSLIPRSPRYTGPR
jgi:hypothetical protein